MSTKRISLSLLFSGLIFALILLVTYQVATEAPSIPEDSLQRIQSKGVLVVGTDIPYGVMEFYDAEGNATGIDIDIVNEFATRLGVKVEIKSMPFDNLFAAIQDHSVDIVASAVTITPERQKTLLFSQPYMDAGMSLAIKADNGLIQSHNDLVGKKVGVLKGTVGEQLASESELFKQSVITSYEVNEQRMQDLQQGVIDAAIVHFLVTDDSRIKLVGEPLKQSFYGIVTHLQNDVLMLELDNILRDMKRSGTLSEIKLKYMGGTKS